MFCLPAVFINKVCLHLIKMAILVTIPYVGVWRQAFKVTQIPGFFPYTLVLGFLVFWVFLRQTSVQYIHSFFLGSDFFVIFNNDVLKLFFTSKTLLKSTLKLYSRYV